MEGAGEQQPDPIKQLVGWAVDHTVVEANFEGERQLLLGDRDGLAQLDVNGVLPLSDAWSWIPDGEGRALVIAGPGSAMDGPWVWAVSTDDGPLASIDVSPDLGFVDTSMEPELLGSLHVESGFIVIGNHNSIRWWGSRAAPSTPEQAAQFRIDEAVPGPLRDSYLVVAAVAAGSVCQVFGARDRHDQLVSFSVKIPLPSWLPQPIPFRDY